MCHSYVMGVDNKIYTLKRYGFTIKRGWKHYKVSFSKDKINIWEYFISRNLQTGYWNEYITDNAVIFIFNLQEGISRYEVYDFENQEVLQLCRKLCGYNFTSIKDMLVSNKFYKKIIES